MGYTKAWLGYNKKPHQRIRGQEELCAFRSRGGEGKKRDEEGFQEGVG